MRPAAIVLAMLLCATTLALGQSTQPSQEGTGASPEQRRRATIGKWVDALAAVEPETRNSARQELMGLSTDDLTILREVLAKGALGPAQIDALREVVIYIHTRYVLQQQPKTGAGFLGVSLPKAAAEQMDDRERARPIGMPVVGRLCGFVAYRYLEDGDIIVEAGPPGETRPTPTSDLLVRSVTMIPAGQPISLRVQRGSRLITLTFELDSSIRTNEIGIDAAGAVQGLIDDARRDAETRLEKEFPSLAEAVEI